MNLLKFLGFGVLIWDVAFITDSVLNTFEIPANLINQTVFIIVGITTLLLTENLNASSTEEVFKYGIAWAIVMACLDMAVATFSLGYSFFQYSNWFNYIVVVFVPVLTLKLEQKKEPTNES